MTIQRIRPMQVFGTLDLDLAIAGTTMTSVGLTNTRLPSIGAGVTYASAVIDPQGQFGAPETIRIVAHTSGVNTATVVRAQEGTTARDHPPGSFWILCPTRDDFEKYLAEFVVTSNTAVTAGTGPGGVPLTATYDPHNLITAGPPGFYTAPVDGWYDIRWGFLFTVTGAVVDTMEAAITNGVSELLVDRETSATPRPKISDRVYVTATTTIIPSWNGGTLSHNGTISNDLRYSRGTISLSEAG